MTYDIALKVIHPNNWAESTVEEKKDALQAIEVHTAKEQGRNPVRIAFQRTSADEMGAYDFFQSKSITINESLLESESSQVAVETVLHEGFHAYQDQMVNGIIEGTSQNADLWKDSLEGRYISYNQNPRGYEEQALERDACEYAEKKARELQFESEIVERGAYSRFTCFSRIDDKPNEEQEEKYRAVRKNNNLHKR